MIRVATRNLGVDVLDGPREGLTRGDLDRDDRGQRRRGQRRRGQRSRTDTTLDAGIITTTIQQSM